MMKNSTEIRDGLHCGEQPRVSDSARLLDEDVDIPESSPNKVKVTEAKRRGYFTGTFGKAAGGLL